MNVYVVTMTAVYDHGCAGVFTTRDAAEQHALSLDADSDGHHTWAIQEMALDHGVELDGRFPYGSTKRIGTGRPEAVEYFEWKP